MYSGMLEFLPERAVLRRELSSGDYPLSAYFFAKTLASVPVRVLLPWVFVTLSYPLVDAQPLWAVYSSLAALVVLSTLAGSSVGACVGCTTLDYHTASSITTVVALAMLIVGGFYLTELPPWVAFLSYTSAFRYSYRASIQVMYGFGRLVDCQGGYHILACAYAEDGTIAESSLVEYTLGVGLDPLYVNVLVMGLFFVLFQVLAYFSLLYGEYDTLFKSI